MPREEFRRTFEPFLAKHVLPSSQMHSLKILQLSVQRRAELRIGKTKPVSPTTDKLI